MNLLRDLPGAGAGEVVERLAGSGGTRVERIVSHGEASPDGFWYDQDEAEFVLVLAGAARLGFADGESLALGVGDWVEIAPHRRHRVEWTDPTQPTVWLAVFIDERYPHPDSPRLRGREQQALAEHSPSPQAGRVGVGVAARTQCPHSRRKK